MSRRVTRGQVRALRARISYVVKLRLACDWIPCWAFRGRRRKARTEFERLMAEHWL